MTTPHPLRPTARLTPQRSRQSGFALIIVLTLMAFLVLLFVTLTVSIQVSNQVSQYNLKSTQARLNALYGVRVAMAQLQKFAGPDTRVTATADIDRHDSSDITTTPPSGFATNSTIDAASGVGVSTNTNTPSTIGGTRYWTGVWGNANPPANFYGSSGGAAPIVLAPPTPVLLTWLVSGDENTTLSVAPNALGGNSSANLFTIKTPTAATPAFAPSITLNDGNVAFTNSTALDSLAITGKTIAGSPANATLLVGPNSAGNATFSEIVDGTSVLQSAPSRYVAAPLVPLTVPGDEDNTPVATGSYAYWVGDEGVKAKYNMADTYGNSTLTSGAPYTALTSFSQANFTQNISFATNTIPKADAYFYRLMAPQRLAVEEMSGLSTYPLNNAFLKSMSEPQEGHYVTTTPGDLIAIDTTMANDPLREHFHDITTYSQGVLADAQRGGLKYDLTTAFEVPAVFSNDLQNRRILPNSGNLTGNTPVANTTTGNATSADYGTSALSPQGGPFWDSVLAYYNSVLTATTATTTGLIPVRPGLAPVIVQGRMQLGLTYDASGQVYIALGVAFVLGNPYNYPITATNGIDLRFTINTHTKSEWGIMIDPTLGGGGAITWQNNQDTTAMNTAYQLAKDKSYYPILNNNVDFSDGSHPSLLDNVTFHLTNTATSGTGGTLTLQPGQAIIYTIPGTSIGSIAASNTWDGNSTNAGNVSNSFHNHVSNIAGSGNRTINLVPLTVSSASLSNYVGVPALASGNAKMNPLPGASDFHLFETDVLPSVACTLQMSTNSTVLQSIMGLDLTGDGVGNTPPLSPLDLKDSDDGKKTEGNDVPHFLVAYYFWLGTPDSGQLTSIDVFNILNSKFSSLYGSGTPPSKNGIQPYINLSTGQIKASPDNPYNGKQFTGTNFRSFYDFNPRATVIAPPPNAPLNPIVPNGTGDVSGNATLNANGFPNVPPYYRLFDPESGEVDQAFIDHTQFINTNNMAASLSNSTANWGHTVANTGNQSVILYNLPWRTPTSSGTKTNSLPVLSLGQLQHADVTADDLFSSVGYQPGNAFGNSYASPFVGTTQSILSLPNFSNGQQNSQQSNLKGLTYAQLGISNNGTGNGAIPTTYANAYDMSYLLNAALWDHYYFSGVAQGSANAGQGGIYTTPISGTSLTLTPNTTSGQMSNPRMKFATGFSPNNTLLNVGAATNTILKGVPDLETATPSQANYMPQGYALSRYLMNDGAFNINSTSVEAWKALLASLRGLPPGPSSAQLATNSQTAPNPLNPSATAVLAFPRVSANLQIATTASLNGNFTYNGTTGSSPSNAPNSGESTQSFAGFRAMSDQDISNLAALIVQQIRARGPFLSLSQFVNRRLGPASDPSSQSGTLQSAIDALPAPAGGTGTFNTMQDLLASNGGNDTLTFNGTYQSIGPMLRSTGIPGWLTQADLLQALAPVLSARSDTFVIRAYGQVNNPLDGSVQSRAWCEAVVQRLPEYVDTESQNPINSLPDNPAVMPWLANYQNNVFGRRFSLVSLRWLNSGDI